MMRGEHIEQLAERAYQLGIHPVAVAEAVIQAVAADLGVTCPACGLLLARKTIAALLDARLVGASKDRRAMTADQVLSVRRVSDDITECRRCEQPVARGRRVAFVAGVGNVCLACLIGHGQADDDETSQ